MRAKVLLLSSCFVATHAMASAGLTSAGVDPGTNTTPEEPTLAQVAPVQGGATGTTAAAIPGTIAGGPAVNVPGGANAVPGTVANGPAGNATTGAAGTTATTAVVAPPPPPDPATLPVSVIRPLNRTGNEQAAATPTSPATTASVDMPAAAPRERHPLPPSAAPTVRSLANAAQNPSLNRIVATPPRVEPGTRATAEALPEDAVDTSSGNVIFYSGTGLAGAILLLSIGSFLRSRSEDAGSAPRA